MLGKLIPILLAVVGLGAGVGAGMALRPDPALMANPCGDMQYAEGGETKAKAEPMEGGEEDPLDETKDYVKLNNQFVIPVVNDGRIGSLVVMSLSLEVEIGDNAVIYRMEPKLRDEFLQVLFDHANAGGFDGSFTKSARMNTLRISLLEAAQTALGSLVTDVLITDVVRQDA